MTTPDRESLASGIVRIGEEAVAKSNDRLFYDYFTEDYVLHSPAGEFERWPGNVRAWASAHPGGLTPAPLPWLRGVAGYTMAQVQVRAGKAKTARVVSISSRNLCSSVSTSTSAAVRSRPARSPGGELDDACEQRMTFRIGGSKVGLD